MNIQIFASDHRRNIDWKLPFIRIGGAESDCAININDDTELSKYSRLLSEGAKMWWVWKHLADFGNPEYIGFCHYRRFFGQSNMLIHDIQEHQLSSQRIFSPIEQFIIMKQNKVDGLVPVQICPLSKNSLYNYSNIIEQTKMISDHDGLGFTTEVVNKAFELLIQNTPSAYISALQQSFSDQSIYVCNIFTMNTKLFRLYGEIIFTTFMQLSEFVKDKDTTKFHPRWMGYIMERFTSCFIKMMQISGKTFQVVPLITIDGSKHEPFEKHIGK